MAKSENKNEILGIELEDKTTRNLRSREFYYQFSRCVLSFFIKQRITASKSKIFSRSASSRNTIQ